MRLPTRADYKLRDERLKEHLAEGKSLESIAGLLGFKNAQVVRVKISKFKRKAREQASADAPPVAVTPAE